MEEVLISVVIPTYKRPQLLQRCLTKLASQNFCKDSYEVIVVSDGPDEFTGQIVQQTIDSKVCVRYLSLRAKKGPAAARNLGWKNARGQLIAFTDDDCLPDPAWLQNMWSCYMQHTHVVFGGKVIVPVNGEPTDFELNTKSLETSEFLTANCACTKEVLVLTGGFDEAFTAAFREDSDFHFKLIRNNPSFLKVNEAIVVHPVRTAPWGVSLKEQKKTMYNALLYKKYPDLYRQRIKPHPNWRYYRILLCLFVSVVTALLGIRSLCIASILLWLALTANFCFDRITRTRKTFSHITEMIVTSFFIPVLSIYWTWTGAIKYRVLFY